MLLCEREVFGSYYLGDRLLLVFMLVRNGNQ